MGKKPDDNENRQSIKKMIHSEMMDRGLVVDKKKKTRSSRDRSRPDRDGTVDRRHRSRSKAGGNDKLTTSSSSTSSSDLRFRSKLKNSKTGSVVTFSSKNESKTFTEIDEKTARSIEDSCSSGVQSGSNNSDLDSLNSASPKPKKIHHRSEKSLVRAAKSSDSDSEEKFKENLRLKAQQRKQRMAEAKVDDQERKLVEFAQRLSARKNKLEELHSRLKQRKATLKEREEKLKIFEAQIVEREEKLRSKSKVVRHKEAKLRHEEGSVKLREESVTDKLSQLEKRTKLIEMKEDLSAEIHDLTRKQLYQSSWNLAGTLKHKKQNKSTNSLDNLSDDETDAIIDELSQMKIAKSRKVGLVM